MLHAYRAFVFGEHGHITDRIELFCEDDEEAMKRAKLLVDGHAVELWDLARKIAGFEPEH